MTLNLDKHRTALPASSIAFQKQRGFALIAVVSILSLVVLIGAAMLQLSSTETREQNLNYHNIQARSNARLALMKALADLQRYAGADQRVTATSSILEAPDAPETTIANRYWTGVWRTDKLKAESLASEPKALIHRNSATSGIARGSLEDRRKEDVYKKKDEVLRWLVSNPGTDTTPIDPATALSTANNEGVNMVGPVNNQLKDSVIVPRVAISDASGASRGGYAYWVGDEGVKARYNLGKNTTTTPVNTSPTDRFGINIVPGFDKYFDQDTTTQKAITRKTSIVQIDPSSSDSSPAREASQNAFHDVTFHSRGVLADTLRGGLKKDLSAYFRNGSAADLSPYHKGIKDTTPLYGGPRLSHLAPKFLLLRHWENISRNRSFSTAMDVIPPKNARDVILWGINGGNGAGNGWSDYREHGIDLSQQDSTPLHPVMVDASFSYGASLTPGAASDDKVSCKIFVHCFPRVVLWNPYNVKLKAASYTVAISRPNWFYVHFNITGDPEINKRQTINLKENPHFSDNRDAARQYFTIPATSFEPGEALVFFADPSAGSQAIHKEGLGIDLSWYSSLIQVLAARTGETNLLTSCSPATSLAPITATTSLTQTPR